MRKWLRQKRKELGLKQEDVAKASGISRQMYAAVETGVRGCPVKTAKKIALAMGFDWTRFYESEE